MSAGVTEPLRTLCGPFCHQIADRSMVSAGVQFPLCWRCAGVWLGFAAGLLFFAWFRRAALPRPGHAAAIAVGLTTPLMLDGAASALDAWHTPGPFRAATGVLLGVGVIWLLSLLSDRPRGAAGPFGAIAVAVCAAAAMVALAGAGVGAGGIAWVALAGWIGMIALLGATAWRTVRPRSGPAPAILPGGAA